VRAALPAALALLAAGPAVAAVTPATVPAPATATARFAIVVGNNRPEGPDTPSLRYADDDAVATHALLVEAGVESVLLARPDDDTRRLYPDARPAGPPRGDELDRALDTLAARMRAEAARGAAVELLFFYSGHGDVDRGEGYVVLEDRRLTRTMLHALLARSPAVRNHVFIDACKSYFLAFEKGPGGTRESYARAFVADAVPAHLANTGFVLSTSSGRDSHEWERYQAGILSHEVRSALRGAADTDGDGTVTYAELGAFLAAANEGIENARYRPDFMVLPPGRNLGQVVLRWSGDAVRGGALRLEAAPSGHVYVETARGVRLLDAHPGPRQALVLHVPDERPLFVRRHDETAEQVVTGRPPPPITALAPAAPEIAMRGALHLAFERLFAAPFSDADVRAFERRFAAAQLPAAAPLPAATVAAAPAPAPPRERHRALRLASGGVAVAAAAVGIASGALALRSYAGGSGGSQVEIDRANRDVRRLDVAAAVSFAVAGAAGLTWGWARWLDGASVSRGAGADGGVTVGLGGHF
jgi:hypothetical protein